MARTINFDFYRVEMPEGAPAQFHEIIERVADSADDGNRTVSIDKCPVRMQRAKKAGGWAQAARAAESAGRSVSTNAFSVMMHHRAYRCLKMVEIS